MDQRRRHGVCVALALACSLMLASAAWGVYTQDFVEPQDFYSGIHDRVWVNADAGGLTLVRSTGVVPFLWIPSPSENTVSKVDARSGLEIARYAIGPKSENWAPCAVACDLYGNAYIACGSYGSTGKIVRISASDGEDRNGDGVTNTCSDIDSSLTITPSEVLVWGADERVSVFAEVGRVNSTPTTILLDSNGYLWVGLCGDTRVVKIDPSTGDEVLSVTLSGKPSAMLMGEQGSIWVLCRDDRVLCGIDTITGTAKRSYDLGACSPAGICMDGNGKIWIGNYNGGLIGFQPRSGVWSRHATIDGAGFAGVTADKDGDIWAACPSNNTVAHFSGEDGSFIAEVPVGKRPESVCRDEAGNVWVLNYDNGTTTRVNTREDKAELTSLICNAPFSNNSFSTFVTCRGTSPIGNWNTVVNSGLQGAGWGTLTWKKSGLGQISMYVRAADALGTLESMDFIEVSSSGTFNTLRGQFLEIRAALRGDGQMSPTLCAVHLEGVNLAPDVKKASATLARIYSSNREMEPVGIDGITDPEGDPVSVTITKVTQDEPVNGLSEDDKGPDATGIGGPMVWLRGERNNTGNGRVYTVHFKAVDCWGATTPGKVKVTVPPGILPTDVAVDDGQKYDSVADQDTLREHEQVAEATAN